jgi:hypothetical protein
MPATENLPHHCPKLEAAYCAVGAALTELTQKVDQLLALAIAYADEQQSIRARVDALEATTKNHAARLVRLEPVPAVGRDGK